MTIWTDKQAEAVSDRVLAYVKEQTAEPVKTDYEIRLEQAKAWQAEQEARPISKTINLLDTCETQAKRVSELVWSSNRVARDVKLRFVSEADAQDIREAITKARHAVIELNEILGLAEVSLAEIVEAGN